MWVAGEQRGPPSADALEQRRMKLGLCQNGWGPFLSLPRIAIQVAGFLWFGNVSILPKAQNCYVMAFFITLQLSRARPRGRDVEQHFSMVGPQTDARPQKTLSPVPPALPFLFSFARP